MLDLTDLLDMNGMTKEQLAQLCNALYRLLQAKIWCVSEQGAHNKCVGQVESSQEERFGTR